MFSVSFIFMYVCTHVYFMCLAFVLCIMLSSHFLSASDVQCKMRKTKIKLNFFYLGWIIIFVNGNADGGDAFEAVDAFEADDAFEAFGAVDDAGGVDGGV